MSTEKNKTPGEEKIIKETHTPNIDFEKTNIQGDIDPINDEGRIKPPGADNVEILGDKSVLEKPIPDITTTNRVVNLNGSPESETASAAAATKPSNTTAASSAKAKPEPEYAIPPGVALNASENDEFASSFNSAQPNTQNTQEKVSDAEDGALRMAHTIHKYMQVGVAKIGGIAGISDKKIKAAEAAGELDTKAILNIPGQLPKTIGTTINEFNLDKRQNIAIPDAWIEENDPLLAHILRKKGAELTIEQLYAINCGSLVIGLGTNIYTSIKQGNELLASLSDLSAQLRQQSAPKENAPASADNGAISAEQLKKEEEQVNKMASEALGEKVEVEKVEKPKRIRNTVKNAAIAPAPATATT
jgi:hypothetical protein